MAAPRKTAASSTKTKAAEASEPETPRRADGTTPEAGAWKEDDGTWSAGCTSRLCGGPNEETGEHVPFRTVGWPSEKVAAERMAEHLREHETGEPMTTLEEFREARGLMASEDGRRAIAALPKGARKIGGRS